MSKIRFTLTAAAVLATVITLAACSSTATTGSMGGMTSETSPSASATPAANTGPHNDADANFATGMVPHHLQAVEMATMILGKTGIDARVTALAKKIKAEQSPEIVTMMSWLKTWGVSTDMIDMPGMAPGQGMMSDADMSALDRATGSTASKLFLTQMIQHHEGALAMAKTELGAGNNPLAVSLAGAIISGQSAEINQMRNLLAKMS